LPTETRGRAFRLSLAGSILIFLNAIWIISNNNPIVITSNPNLTTVSAINNSTAFWGRISFGFQGIVEGSWTPFWLIFTIALFVCTIQIYRKPRAHKVLGLPMMIFSLLSLPIGGGFLIGSILAFIGGMLAVEWPKPFSNTFVGKMMRIAKLDTTVFGQLSGDSKAMGNGALALLFASIVMGFGNAVYVFNVNLIKTKPVSANEILLLGKLNMDVMTMATAFSFVGIIFLRWLAFSAILYVITVKLKGHIADFDKLACAIAFAFVPLCIQGFLPILFSNEPYLSIQWPFAIVLLSVFWVALIVLVFIKSVFEIKRREALGVTLLAGSLYLLLELLAVSNPLVVLNTSVSMPGIAIQVQAASLSSVLFFFSLAVFVSILLGALTPKHGR